MFLVDVDMGVKECGYEDWFWAGVSSEHVVLDGVICNLELSVANPSSEIKSHLWAMMGNVRIQETESLNREYGSLEMMNMTKCDSHREMTYCSSHGRKNF